MVAFRVAFLHIVPHLEYSYTFPLPASSPRNSPFLRQILEPSSPACSRASDHCWNPAHCLGRCSSMLTTPSLLELGDSANTTSLQIFPLDSLFGSCSEPPYAVGSNTT